MRVEYSLRPECRKEGDPGTALSTAPADRRVAPSVPTAVPLPSPAVAVAQLGPASRPGFESRLSIRGRAMPWGFMTGVPRCASYPAELALPPGAVLPAKDGETCRAFSESYRRGTAAGAGEATAPASCSVDPSTAACLGASDVKLAKGLEGVLLQFWLHSDGQSGKWPVCQLESGAIVNESISSCAGVLIMPSTH